MRAQRSADQFELTQHPVFIAVLTLKRRLGILGGVKSYFLSAPMEKAAYRESVFFRFFFGFFLRVVMVTFLAFQRVSIIRSVTLFFWFHKVMYWYLVHFWGFFKYVIKTSGH